jgi:2-polyprenyl-6-hydroxyphenyl methylase/3-demethylubiquinone-9 3-methyltransferase
VAELHKLESGAHVTYRRSTAEQAAAEEPEHYDVVCCLEMLEHVPDPGSVIAACARLARHGATLYFSTINRNPKAYAFAIVGAEYVLNLLPKGTHDYQKFIRPAELAYWIRAAGLELEEMIGLTYNPLSKHYRLQPGDVSVNYMARTRKP